MNIPCLYTTRKTQKSKRWQDGHLIVNTVKRDYLPES